MTVTVEPLKPTSIISISNISAISGRNVQSAYQQSDISFLTARHPNEIPSDPSETIVLQYGSRNFKVGFAKDALPHSGTQVIAYKDAVFPSEIQPTGEINEEELQERLAARYKTAKKKPPPNLYTSLLAFNKASVPQTISALNDAYGFEWTKTKDTKYVTGQAALRINPTENYRRRWPIRRGNFNKKQYKSYREVIDDLELIWSAVMMTDLKVPRKDFRKYGMVLVVPDCIKVFEVKALTELLVKMMGFKCVAFIQESVSGTFGTGISSACVIDLGAQLLKVSCVEDGQIVKETQTISPYGGEDLTRLYHQILKIHNFPYHECDLLENILDFEMMDELKIRMCTMDEDDLSSAVYEAYVRDPGHATQVYPFKVFEERVIVPAALFESGVPLVAKLLAINDKDDKNTLDFYSGEHDAMDLYFTTTTQTSTNEADDLQGEPLTIDNAAIIVDEDLKGTKIMDIDESAESNGNFIYSISDALFKAFDAIDNPDRLKKFTSSILIIGNGHKFKRLVHHIGEILRNKYPDHEIDFILGGGTSSGTGGKENLTLDSGIVGWKGGAVFAKLDCSNDSFISYRDYETCGPARAIRERLIFSTC